MEILLAHLRDVWGLHVKADSKRILTVKGAGDDILVGTHWIAEDVSDVLGWPIQADGGHSACWSRMLAKMWASFYSNVKARGWRKLGMRRRLALLQRCVAPIVAHYAAIIPPQHAYGVKIDRVQRRMVSAAMATQGLPSSRGSRLSGDLLGNQHFGLSRTASGGRDAGSNEA